MFLDFLIYMCRYRYPLGSTLSWGRCHSFRIDPAAAGQPPPLPLPTSEPPQRRHPHQLPSAALQTELPHIPGHHQQWYAALPAAAASVPGRAGRPALPLAAGLGYRTRQQQSHAVILRPVSCSCWTISSALLWYNEESPRGWWWSLGGGRTVPPGDGWLSCG